MLVAAVGDSNTYGAGAFFDDLAHNSYPAQLEALLGASSFAGTAQVLNYGLSGRTLLDTGDFPYTDSRFFALSHEVGPQVVLIMLGSNDAKPQNWNAERYEAQLRDVVDSYTGLPGHPEVYLLTPPAAFANTGGIDPVVVADEVVPIVTRVGEEVGVPVIDVYAATANRPELFSDGIHPDATGLGIIAAAVYEALSR